MKVAVDPQQPPAGTDPTGQLPQGGPITAAKVKDPGVEHSRQLGQLLVAVLLRRRRSLDMLRIPLLAPIQGDHRCWPRSGYLVAAGLIARCRCRARSMLNLGTDQPDEQAQTTSILAPS